MRLKAFGLFLSTVLIGGVFYSFPSKALSPTDPTSEKYLLDHGHSQEIVRMINIQKDRTEGKTLVAPKSENKFKKFLKNIWFEQDLTMPTTDFGYNNINTVETDKSVIPPTVKLIKSKYLDKDKDLKEINVTDVKVRETE